MDSTRIAAALITSALGFALAIPASAQMIPMSFINTAKQAMWDQYVFNSTVDAVNSVRGKQSSAAPSTVPQTTWDQPLNAGRQKQHSAPPYDETVTWKRYATNGATLSALCPPGWTVQASPDDENLALSKEDMDSGIVLMYASSKDISARQAKPVTALQNFVDMSMQSSNRQRPRGITATQLETSAGPGYRMAFSYLLQKSKMMQAVHEQLLEYLIVQRPGGYLFVMLETPAESKASAEQLQQIFSHIGFAENR